MQNWERRSLTARCGKRGGGTAGRTAAATKRCTGYSTNLVMHSEANMYDYGNGYTILLHQDPRIGTVQATDWIG